MQAQLAANRSAFYRAVAAGPFYGFNRPGREPEEAIVANWWRQGMTGSAKAQYDSLDAIFSTDFNDDLPKVTLPVLLLHGDDDQIVPLDISSAISSKLLPDGTLKVYPGFAHGMATTEAPTINADLLEFIRS